MLINPTPDQDLFQKNTARFIADQAPPAELRRLRDDPAGFEAEYWERGAALGWTSLLVDEAHGGGSISDAPLVDLTLVAYEFGRHAAPGPLVPVNLVASALGADVTDAHSEVLEDLLSGARVASWCFSERAAERGADDLALSVVVDGDDVLLDGVKRPVESARQATHLLVTGRTGSGLTQVLLPSDTPGVRMRPMRSVDMTRRFWEVAFEGVRVPTSAVVGAIGEAGDQVAYQLQLAAVLLAAESVGAMQAAFDMTVAWGFERYSFGRPLASYQAIKHRFAHMKSWLEAAHAVSDAAAAAVAGNTPDAAELASVAKAFVGDHGTELGQECVQLHGGIGVTQEHDLHLFLRRMTLDRTLYGSPAAHRQLIATITEQREAAA